MCQTQHSITCIIPSYSMYTQQVFMEQLYIIFVRIFTKEFKVVAN